MKIAKKPFNRILSSLATIGVACFSTASADNPTPNQMINHDADGSIVEIKPDGTKLIKKRDGTLVQVLPDGSKTVKTPDGTIVEVKADGTKTIKKNDGSSIEIKPNKD